MRRATLLLLLLMACGDKSPPPSPTCTKVGDQCTLPTAGPLGVCNSVPCKDGETPPCLKCMSQH